MRTKEREIQSEQIWFRGHKTPDKVKGSIRLSLDLARKLSGIRTSNNIEGIAKLMLLNEQKQQLTARLTGTNRRKQNPG